MENGVEGAKRTRVGRRREHPPDIQTEPYDEQQPLSVGWWGRAQRGLSMRGTGLSKQAEHSGSLSKH